MTYICPVCGYDELTQPPENFSICECCGTEFGNDDFDRSHAELRREWISNDMPWFSRSVPAPKNWSSLRQLIIAEHGADLARHPRFKDDLDFRSDVNKAFSEVLISKQLKALREREEEPLTQTELAEKAGMKQSRISELEGMNYSSWSISTLERLAKALGVSFSYSFVPWSELLSRMERGFDAEALAVPSFEQEITIDQETPIAAQAESYTGVRLRLSTVPITSTWAPLPDTVTVTDPPYYTTVTTIEDLERQGLITWEPLSKAATQVVEPIEKITLGDFKRVNLPLATRYDLFVENVEEVKEAA